MADRQERIVAAFKAVEAGMAVREASKRFNIPRSTLKDKVHGRTPLIKQRRTVLTPEEEDKFSQWAIQMARTGFGRTCKDFCRNVQEYLNQLREKKLRFKNDNLPGTTWYSDYLRRHPELTERVARPLGVEKAIVTPAKAEAWFDGLKSYIEAADPSLLEEPARWYNCNESGFAVSFKSRRVLSPKATAGDKHLNLTTSSLEQHITTHCCMSAVGHFISPLIVLPGKRLCTNPTQYFKECAVGLSVKGGMTGDLFVSWLEKVFLPELDKRSMRRPVLLFLDGSSTHKSYKASNICLKNGVILYCLQANAAHLLEPLGLSAFGSLKSQWEDAVMDFQVKNPGMCVTKTTFALVFKAAYEKLCMANVARADFKKAGLFPLNKTSKKMLASSILTAPTTAPCSPPLSSSSSSSSSSPPPLSTPLPPPSSSSSSCPAPSMSEKLRVLESCMEEEQKMAYEIIFQQGHDIQYDTMYNAWKKCKMAVLSGCASTVPASNPNASFTSTQPASRGLFSAQSSMASSLVSTTPQARKKKSRRKEMVLTSKECMDFFKKNKQELDRRKRDNEKSKGKKNVTKKGGKGAKRKRTESLSDDESDLVLDDEVDERVTVIECARCEGWYKSREASEWLGCDSCERWYHKRCVRGLDVVELDEESLKNLRFVCDVCL